MLMADKVQLTFQEIADRLRDFSFPDLDAVVGIESGGRVPAALIAFLLNKPLFALPINYRDEANQPRYSQPETLRDHYPLPRAGAMVLVVDDVSVTGSTLKTAANILSEHHVRTFTLKGQAELVLFPEIEPCVHWPWKSC